MSPEEKDLLQKAYDLAKENNHMLKKLRNSNRWSLFFGIVKWIIIIGISVGAFYFVQPYFDKVLGAYNSIQSSLNTVKTATNKVLK